MRNPLADIHRHDIEAAVRVATAVGLPLLALDAIGRLDLAVYAAFGGLAMLYGHSEPAKRRVESQIVAGAGLSFAEVKRRRVAITAVTVVKLGVMPPLMWFIAWALGGDSLAQGIALICGAAPGSAASDVRARQMGGDAPLIAGVIALTTVASAFVIPLLLALFQFA